MAAIDWITLTMSGSDAQICLADIHRHLASYSATTPYDAPTSRYPDRVDYRYPAVPARLAEIATGRYMMTCSGPLAHQVMMWLLSYLPDAPMAVSWSYARLDVQRTVVVPDADAIIGALQSSPRYHRLLLDPRPNRGMTLYVGSPRSRARVRIYNKSVQASVWPDDASGEYLRIEYQARDIVADQIVSQLIVNGQAVEPHQVLAAYLASKIRVVVPDLAAYLTADHCDLPPVDRGAPRYAEWLFHTVLPALRRVELLDNALYRRFVNALSGGQIDERDV